MPAEHREKIRAAATGRIMGPQSAAHREKIRAALKGKKKTASHIAAARAARTYRSGYSLTDAHRNKISLAASSRARGLCVICGRDEVLVRDHDHKTGLDRATIGNLCNQGLGYFKDDPVALRAAADYLERHSKVFQ